MSLSIGNRESKFVTIWESADKGKYVDAKTSTGRKDDRESTGYKNSSWNIRFVGNCVDMAKTLQRNDKIKITNGYVENTFDKEANKLWINVTVFDFEFEDGYGGNEVEAEDDIPY